MLILTSDPDMPIGSYSDSELEIKLMHYTWKLPIKASFFSCKLTSLGFKTPTSTVTYPLGLGKLTMKLPDLK